MRTVIQPGYNTLRIETYETEDPQAALNWIAASLRAAKTQWPYAFKDIALTSYKVRKKKASKK